MAIWSGDDELMGWVEMLHEDRLTYGTLKEWALECYYEGCRDHAVMKGWPHDQIMGYVVYQFEGTFERPVEIFMWRVVLLVLSGGWKTDWYLSAREVIIEEIDRVGLDIILVGVFPDEIAVFKHDLKVLGII